MLMFGAYWHPQRTRRHPRAVKDAIDLGKSRMFRLPFFATTFEFMDWLSLVPSLPDRLYGKRKSLTD